MITADGEAAAAGAWPGPVLAIRDRTDSDLDECVSLLAEVHRRDGYPMRWPADPRRFLSTPKIFAAWVATVDGQVVGHVCLSVITPGDVAPHLLGRHDAAVSGGGRTAQGVAAVDGAVPDGGAVGGGAVPDGGAVGGGGVADGGGVTADSGAVGSGGVVMLSRLFVSAAARGHGAGSALVHRAVQAAHERGQHPLLDVHSAGTSAIALYERLGWNFLGTAHVQWGPDRVTVHSYTAPPRAPATSGAPPAQAS